MKRILSILLVAVPAAVVALLWTSAPLTAQPVPPPGLRAVQHGSAFSGSGTTAAPLNLTPQSCAGSGSAVAGWGSDGTPTCVATGTLDGTGSAGKLTYWTDADTLGYGTGSTSVQHQGSLSVTQDLSASGILYVLGKLSDSTGFGTSGQVLTVNGSGYPRWTAPSGGDIEGITTTSPLSGGCTSGTCALTTSMSTARILGRTTASTGVVEQLTGTQATAMLDVATSALKGLVPAWPNNTTTFFRGDGTYATPPDADHALVTSGAIPRGNGTTQVASLLSDDGSTVTNAGDTDLTAGVTTVGAFGGTVERYSASTAINDYPLGATTTTLIIDASASVAVQGIANGWDGRELTVILKSSLSVAPSLVNESSGSTLANRILVPSGTWAQTMSTANQVGAKLIYDGDVSRWRAYPIGWTRVPRWDVAGAFTVGGTATLNGDTVVGNASTDTLTVNATSTLNADATFDEDVVLNDSSTDTTTVNGLLNATYAAIVGGLLSANGSAVVGDADSDYLDARGTLAFSGTDATAGAGATTVTGEAQSFRVTCSGSSITACVVNFNRTFNSAPYCVITDGASGTENHYVGAATTTTMTITFPTPTSKANTFNVFCPDRR